MMSDILKLTWELHPKNCQDVMWPLNADLLITHMPVSFAKGYGKGIAGFIANKAFSSLNNNCLAFVVVSSLKEDKLRPYEVIQAFVAAGFKYIDTIVWIKNKIGQTQGSKRLNNSYDHILMLAKGVNYHLNRQSIAHIRNRIDGNSNEYICPGNAWKIAISKQFTLPEELITYLIKLANLIPNSMILNPFAEDGSILKVANDMGHSYWGTEKDKKLYAKCKRIIKGFLQ